MMPEPMIEAGFDKHILPRFRFKHRIEVAPVSEGGDMAFSDDGARVFAEGDTEWHLEIATNDATKKDHAQTFLKWLRSDPGKAAIEGFAPNGEPVFTTEVSLVTTEAVEVFEGDEAKGGDLAILHCGRCHVVDERNKWGGIGSTPSFKALRGRENWSNLFANFYTHNPHPSFTQVENVTEPFDPDQGRTIVPVEMTVDDLDAILAFVAKLEPLDLGAPVSAR